MTSGKSFITAFGSSSLRQPIDPVGQARIACSGSRRSAPETGWALTKDVSAASPNTEGAICRHASQSMQVESTKKSPGTVSGTRSLGFAMIGPPSAPFYPREEGLESWRRPGSLRRRSLAEAEGQPDHAGVGTVGDLLAPTHAQITAHHDQLLRFGPHGRIHPCPRLIM